MCNEAAVDPYQRETHFHIRLATSQKLKLKAREPCHCHTVRASIIELHVATSKLGLHARYRTVKRGCDAVVLEDAANSLPAPEVGSGPRIPAGAA